MKKLSTLLLAMLATATAASAASPVMIGRRGCGYAVENSAEAFSRGADMGFKIMECHVRVAGDSTFVASHDGKTARLGGNLKVEKSTLPELAAETYTQTVNGTPYTGGILTVAQYLDTCNSRGLTPLLHLKTLGKGNKDTSPLPALMDLIASRGLTEKCIILTSSPEYIEFLQANYPSAPLQFQADGKWREMLDWIIAHKVDVDIKSDFVDAETVDAFHSHGLKVTTWTVNDIADYLRLASLGVDYMITDFLGPRSLPEQ